MCNLGHMFVLKVIDKSTERQTLRRGMLRTSIKTFDQNIPFLSRRSIFITKKNHMGGNQRLFVSIARIIFSFEE